MEPLSTNNIDDALCQYTLFKGTYPCDLVPISLNIEPQAYVVNTENSHSSGKHWIGLIIKQTQCWYFDSFGNELLNLDILSSLRKIGIKKYFWSCQQIQSVYSNSCGYFCIAFVLSFISGIKYEDFLSEFSENVDQNDLICLSLIKRYSSTASQITNNF